VRVGPLTIEVPVLLAPMAAVTDLPFRTVCEEMGVGLTITEFLSAHALTNGARKTVDKMTPSLDGRRFGVQIFGREHESMARAAEMAVGIGAALVDINMGCPAKKVVAGECGSALMKEPALAQELVRTVQRAVPRDVPVTVKHRAGWDELHKNAAEFAVAMVEAGAAMITVHGRTRTQGFAGRADLGIIAKVRAAVPSRVPVVGNGDVVDLDGYIRMRGETGCDAVMIGRGAMGNPFLFRSIRALDAGEQDPGPPTPAERARAFARHVELIVRLTPPPRQVTELRKACAWYAKGVFGANSLRQRVWALTDAAAIVAAGREFFAALGARPLTSTVEIPLMDGWLHGPRASSSETA
jgi:nifR3 family TIM-barrel protein